MAAGPRRCDQCKCLGGLKYLLTVRGPFDNCASLEKEVIVRNKFKLSRVAASIAVAITGLSVSQLTIAGAGFADAIQPDGVTTFRKATFFAYSPSGTRDTAVPEDDLLTVGGTKRTANYTGKALRKFVDPLPIPGKVGALSDGTVKYIPVAVPSKWVNPQGVTTNNDYYEIGIVEYAEKFHSDLKKASKMRGYVQIDHEASNGRTPLPGSKSFELKYPDGTNIMIAATDANGKLTGGAKVKALAVEPPHFLGPVIAANKDIPTRLKVLNLLPVGRAQWVEGVKTEIDPVSGDAVSVPTFTVTARNGDLFLPVDKSILGAGVGPDGLTEYTQNRASVHLHGGDTPWISDGTPHQWITPAGENDPAVPLSLAAAFNDANGNLDPNMLDSYIKGVSTRNVPDMNDPGDGAMTLYYPNGHTARMEWYHDHTFGSTRLNVYAGMASAYLVTDSVEAALINGGPVGPVPAPGANDTRKTVAAVLPPADRTIPLVLQDRTFVPDDIDLQDAHWNTTAWGEPGDSWFPHVYETVQDPNQANNWNTVGRWHYGPWFWPVFPALYSLPEGTYSPSGFENTVTTTPEGWNDTPIVNGVAYPTLEVEPTTYRFRMLNASNDRMMTVNMFLAKADATLADGTVIHAAHPQLDAAGLPVLDSAGQPVMVPVESEIDMVPAGAPLAANACAPIPDGKGGFVDARRPTLLANGTWCTPVTWPTDGRLGGVPSPAGVGPAMYQVANESGWLPKVATYEPTPINYIQDKGRIVVLNVDLGNSGLLIAPAERADVVVDFTAYAGKTLLVYNDSGAPVPAGDPRNDLFTGVGDQAGQGGAEDTKPGYGPNTRTMMQIKVKAASATTPAANFSPAALDTALQTAYFSDDERRPVVAQDVYSGFNPDWANLKPVDMYGDIYLGSLKNPTFVFTPGKLSDGGIANVLLDKDPITGVVTSGGHGYVHAPSVTIDAPLDATGQAATAVATMKVDQIAVTNAGLGYTTAPLMSFSGGGGNGVMANAYLRVNMDAADLNNGPKVTAPGAGYPASTQMKVSFTPSPAGVAATATGYAMTNASGQVSSIVVTSAGSGYTSIPLVTILNRTVLNNALVGGKGAKATVTGLVDAIVLYGTDHTTAAMNALTSGGGGYSDLTPGVFNVNIRGGLKLDANGAPAAGTVNAVGVATGKVSDVTLTHPGSKYGAGEKPVVHFVTADAGVTAASATATPADVAGSKASYQVKTKTIQELFDPTYGRLNATLGIELPFTSALTQTTLPLGYVDENTEEFANGETQIWKITHNGVDSHPVHFHLLDVQVVNRVGWDGFIQPIEPKEMGWKETVMMSPLEDIIVAVRAKTPKLPGFGVPVSTRLMDPTQPEGSPFGFTQIDPLTGNPKVVTNAMAEFGWEYVWHCHILGHEENDFMRPIKFNANEILPGKPLFPAAVPDTTTGAVTVTWTDNSLTEYKFEIQRASADVTVDADLLTGLIPEPVVGAFAKVGDALANATEYLDTTAEKLVGPVTTVPGKAYVYKVVAIGAKGSNESVPVFTPNDTMTIPTAPSGLTVTGTSGSQVALSWTDASNNESGFLVESRTSADLGVTWSAWAPLSPTTALAGGALVNIPQNTTSYVNSGLAPNTAVSYRVSAANIKGQSGFTNTIDTVTNSAPTVSGLTAAAALTADSVTLNWSLTDLANPINQGVTGYVVTRTGGLAGQATFQVAGGKTKLTWSDVNVAQNTSYTYTVYAVNAAGMSPVNGIASNSAAVTTPYGAVGQLAPISAVASAAGTATTVTVTWSAATPATRYVLQRSADNGITWSAPLADVATPPVGGYVDSTVAPLSNYKYRVTATNGNSASSSTQEISVTTNAAIVVLPPSGLTAAFTNFATRAATLTWTDQATNETNFVVERSGDGVTWTAEATLVAPRTGTTGLTRTANVTVPTGGVTQYRVRALNDTAGIRTYSVDSNIVTLDTVLAAPGAPTAAIVSTTRITLSWLDNSTNETSFQVFRSANSGATFTQACTATRSAAQGAATGGALVTCNDNGVTLGNTYQYYVVAVNSGVTSAPSAISTVTFALPTAPAALVATPARVIGSNTRSDVTLTWGTLPAGATVTVRRITPAGGGTATLLTNSTATTFVDLGLRRNASNYIYEIRYNVGPLSSAYTQTSVLVN